MYYYETHLHTAPISACAKSSVRESLEFYKSIGYAGVFMTDHFIDGNFELASRELPYAERIKRYFSAYEEGRIIGEEIGISVFPGFEMAHGWAHFLVYGIDCEWCLGHADMDKMKKSDLLSAMIDDGALIIQAHPFRTVKEEIRLYPNHVHGVEIVNTARGDFENRLALQYCENYGLIKFAGSDNHWAGAHKKLGGVATEKRIESVADFKETVLSGGARPFVRDESGFVFLDRDEVCI